MIAKALSHDPELLFLDEPTAGVDVELRRDMWKQIGALRDKGTTIILTTHYIEEAQEMADRVGVFNKGKLLLVDDKQAIMAKLGSTEARIHARANRWPPCRHAFAPIRSRSRTMAAPWSIAAATAAGRASARRPK
jgi:ABC-type multidrug transport system ATPase subunit